MMVALVLDIFDGAGGGLERWTTGFAQFLHRRGHDVHVVAFGGATDLPIRLHVLAPERGLLARAISAETFLAGLKADAVLDTGTCRAGDVFMPCTGSRQWSQRRLVATHAPLMRLRAALSPKSRHLDWTMRRIERQQVQRARHVIAVSSPVGSLLRNQHAIAPDRMSVIPNGVDTARFGHERLALMRPAARTKLGVQGSTVFLGSAHNLFLKGMDTAIRALRVLVHGGADAVLAIAGGVPGKVWHALSAGLGERVMFLGPVDDMTPLFAAADALVHPTRWDACSLSTIEAGAAGLPVITTSRNGAAELIRNDETGFILADPEDVPALADRMGRLLDPSLRARMGGAARVASYGHDVRANYTAVEAVLLANSRDHRPRAAAPSAARDRWRA